MLHTQTPSQSSQIEDAASQAPAELPFSVTLSTLDSDRNIAALPKQSGAHLAQAHATARRR